MDNRTRQAHEEAAYKWLEKCVLTTEQGITTAREYHKAIRQLNKFAYHAEAAGGADGLQMALCLPAGNTGNRKVIHIDGYNEKIAKDLYIAIISTPGASAAQAWQKRHAKS